MQSSHDLLEELSNDPGNSKKLKLDQFDEDIYHALCFFLVNIVDLTKVECFEVVTDSTHGVNSLGAELFGLTASMDVTGFPLGYMVLKKKQRWLPKTRI